MPAPPSVASRASRSAGSEDISGSEASSSEEEPPRRTTRLLTGSLPRKAPPRTRASLPERNSQSPKRTGHSAASELHRQRGRRDDSDSVASFNARQRKAAVQEDSASEDSFDVGEELTQAMLRASKDFGKLTEEMREFHVECVPLES